MISSDEENTPAYLVRVVNFMCEYRWGENLGIPCRQYCIRLHHVISSCQPEVSHLIMECLDLKCELLLE